MRVRFALTAALFLVFCVSAYGIQVSLPEISAERGTDIEVEISVDDTSGITGGDINLEYDPAVLTVKDAQPTDLLAGLLVQKNFGVAGEVKFAMAGFAGLAGGSGAIFKITFTIAADAYGETALTLTRAKLFDENVSVIETTVVDGSINVRGEAVTAEGTLVKLDVTTFMYGTHGLQSGGDLAYALKSATIDLDQFIDLAVTVQGELIHNGLDGGPPYVDVTDVEVHEVLPSVVKDHTPGAPMLALQATYDQANVHGHAYIDIWKSTVPAAVEEGDYLEFQIIMFSGIPTFKASVDLHTTDGTTLRDSGASDQNDASAHPSADLSQYAENQWYHRTIPLAPLAGKIIDGVMIATDSNEHEAGIFRAYVDNIQITDGTGIKQSIWMGENTIPATGTNVATETTLAGTDGMSDYSVSIVSETPVAPAGKLATSWGKVKNSR